MPATVTYSNHPPGLPHARDTVKKMSDLAREAAHTYEIRNLATRIVAHVPSKQPEAELAALYKWVRENIRYRNDPHGLEWIQSPRRILLEKAGDCNNIATLLMAFAQTLGRPTRLEIVGERPGAYKHVYVQAQLPNGRWVTMDPVLEPPSDGRRRVDLGKFGHRAVGHRLRFSDRGEQMALSGPTSARDRLLWQTVPYFPQVSPTSGYASPADAGRRPAPDYAYRSAVVPGPTIAGPPRSGVMPYLSGLGHYTAVDGRPYNGQVALGDNGELVVWDESLGIWGFLKKVGKAVGKVAKVVTKIPGVSMVASLVPGGSAILEAAKVVGKISGGGRKRKARVKRRGRVKAGRPRGRGVPRVGGRAARAARVKRRKRRRPKRKPGLRAMRRMAKRAKSRVVRRRRPKSRIVRKARKKRGPSKRQLRRRRRRKVQAARKRPHPELRSAYPPDARQLWDSAANVYRIYLPVSGMSGVGQLPIPIPIPVPLPFLGACPVCPPGWTQVRPGSPGSVPASQAWAQHRSGLGAAFRPSISFSLGEWREGVHRHTLTLPTGEVLHTSFDGWLTNGHPVLGQVANGTRRAAAQAAVEAVAKHIASRGDKRPPGRSVAAVMAFQKTDPNVAGGGRAGGLAVDGLWGLNSQVAVAYYLGVSPATLPPVLPVFKRKRPTWFPEPVAAPAPPVKVSKPLPAPTPIRRPAPTPAPTTRIITKAPTRVIAPPAPAPVRVVARPPVKVVVAPAPRKLEVLRRDPGSTAPIRRPAPTPPVASPRYPKIVVMPKSTPHVREPAPGAPWTHPPPPPGLRLPTLPGPVPPVPVAPPVNVTAAPPGQYPPGAVYRDGAGTPRVSGYAEVDRQADNPGMDPVGMNPPPSPTPSMPVDAQAPYYDDGGTTDVYVEPRGGGMSDNTWIWVIGALLLSQRRGKKAA